MNNLIDTWTQSHFVDQHKYSKMSPEEKQKANKDESHRVKNGVLGNAICTAVDPQSAQWIAERLNLASKLERMTYDFATGKTDGSEIILMVMKHVNS